MLFFADNDGLAQKESIVHSSDSTVITNHYRKLSIGLNRPVFRDFATSPLFYNGTGIALALGFNKVSPKMERSLDISGSFNMMQARIPDSEYLQASSNSRFVNLNLRYLRLWALGRFSSERNKLKVGGVFLSSQNLRINPALQNNRTGLENLTNVMLSTQLNRDISRKQSRTINLLFFKPKLKEVRRELRFQLNIGVLNFNYRPTYAYLFHESMGNTDESKGRKNELSMNGWRFGTEIEISRFLFNGNMRSIAYLWDAVHAPGSYSPFQMASHQIRYSIYFQTKKR